MRQFIMRFNHWILWDGEGIALVDCGDHFILTSVLGWLPVFIIHTGMFGCYVLATPYKMTALKRAWEILSNPKVEWIHPERKPDRFFFNLQSSIRF